MAEGGALKEKQGPTEGSGCLWDSSGGHPDPPSPQEKGIPGILSSFLDVTISLGALA